LRIFIIISCLLGALARAADPSSGSGSGSGSSSSSSSVSDFIISSLFQGGAENRTGAILSTFASQQRRFSTVDNLVRAIGVHDKQIQADEGKLNSQITELIQDRAEQLFRQPDAVVGKLDKKQVKKLIQAAIKHAKGNENTNTAIVTGSGTGIGTATGTAATGTDIHMDMDVDTVAAVTDYLDAFAHQIAAAAEDKEVTAGTVTATGGAGGAGKSAGSVSSEFDNMDSLINAVNVASEIAFNAKLAVLARLQPTSTFTSTPTTSTSTFTSTSTPHTLLRSHPDTIVSLASIDRLLSSADLSTAMLAADPDEILRLLDTLEQRGESYDTLEQLAEAMKKEAQELQITDQEAEEMLNWFKNNEIKLIDKAVKSGSSSSKPVNRDDVVRLFRVSGGSVSATLSYLESLKQQPIDAKGVESGSGSEVEIGAGSDTNNNINYKSIEELLSGIEKRKEKIMKEKQQILKFLNT